MTNGECMRLDFSYVFLVFHVFFLFLALALTLEVDWGDPSEELSRMRESRVAVV